MNLKKCNRCSKYLKEWSVSFFNKDILCLSCIEIEKQHPNYKKAKEVELQEVKRGNYDFEGVGLPEDFYQWLENLPTNEPSKMVFNEGNDIVVK